MYNHINFLRPIININENLNALKCLVSTNNIKKNSGEIRKIINKLANGIEVHRKMKANFLKNNFYNDRNKDLKSFKEEYKNEWAFEDYNEYKRKYTSAVKICSDINIFKKETEEIVRFLEDRLGQEKLILFSLVN